MLLTVDENILEQTTHCDNEFSCQGPGWKSCGKITGIIENRMLEEKVDSSCERKCSYRVEFGKGVFCQCPTRIEIYKCYGV